MSEASSKLEPCLRSIELPHTRFSLANGLRVIVCRRDGCAQVGVNVCYHAGSSAEEPGKAGLAHLVEHLMYTGTQHHPQGYALALEQLGATTVNANATEDYSTYFETVPSGALDLVLWMEAERMGCLLGALDQEKLKREREVVRNEIRQRDSEPFGTVKRIIRQRAYPADHPYRSVALGSAQELDTLSLADVERWLTRFHCAANALLVIAGDVDPDSVATRAERFFAHIANGHASDRRSPRVAPPVERARRVVPHSGSKTRVYKVWNVPEWSRRDHAMLEVAAHTLAAGTISILWQRLVEERELATEIGFELSEGELGSQLLIYADCESAAGGADLSAAIDQETDRFLRGGPPLARFDATRMTLVSRWLKDLEHLTGPRSLTHALAMGELLAANPLFFRERLKLIASAAPEEILDSAERWLGAGALTLEARPSSEHEPAPEQARYFSAQVAKRSRVARESPARTSRCIGPPTTAPETEHRAVLSNLRVAKLKNGLTLFLIERKSAPIVNLRLVVRAAARAQWAQHPRRRGLAGMAAAMLGRGTVVRNRAQIGCRLAQLGAEFKSRLGLDAATLELSVLGFNLEAALDLLGEIALRPAFFKEEFSRLKRRRLREIEGEKARPYDLALRVIPRLVYGDAHPFAQPLSGLGEPSDVETLEPEQVADFYRRWAQPDLAALIVVGEFDSSAAASAIENSFDGWTDQGGEGQEIILHDGAQPRRAGLGCVFAVHRPGWIQSAVSIGWAIPLLEVADEAAWLMARALAADMFSSRLNSLLRERMSCSYGPRCFAAQAQDGGLYLIHSLIAVDATGAAVRAIRCELEKLCAPDAITAAELARAQTYLRARLAALNETGAQVADAAEKIASRKLAPDYYDRLVAELDRVKPPDIARAAQNLLHPDTAAWLVAGDMNVVGKQLRELECEIKFLDAGGELIGS